MCMEAILTENNCLWLKVRGCGGGGGQKSKLATRGYGREGRGAGVDENFVAT